MINTSIDKEQFDPNVIHQLGRLDFIAKSIIDGVNRGVHQSRRRGFSTEFSDFKPYEVGDDLRLLDWRLYARTDKLFVKRFEAETSLELNLILDATGSMAWRWENNISKLEYATNLLAAIAALHINNRDNVGLLLYDANKVHHLPPRARKSHLDDIFSTLASVVPGHAESFPVLIENLTRMSHHQGRIIICSDLEEDEDKIEEAINEISGLKDDIILVHILDKAEVELPFESITHLQDAETGELVAVHLPTLKKHHEENLKIFRERWQNKCKNWGILYFPIDTSMNYVDTIIKLLEEYHLYFT